MIKIIIKPVSVKELDFHFEVLRQPTKYEMRNFINNEELIRQTIMDCADKTVFASEGYSQLSLGGFTFMVRKVLETALGIRVVVVIDSPLFSQAKILAFADEIKKDDDFDKAS